MSGYWRAIPGTKYFAGKRGEIRHQASKSCRMFVQDEEGYLKVGIRVGLATPRLFYVHRLVAMAHCTIPRRHKGKTFEDLQVNHKNSLRDDNRVDNLEWVTKDENLRQRYAIARAIERSSGRNANGPIEPWMPEEGEEPF